MSHHDIGLNAYLISLMLSIKVEHYLQIDVGKGYGKILLGFVIRKS
jgi:hypothetical protein